MFDNLIILSLLILTIPRPRSRNGRMAICSNLIIILSLLIVMLPNLLPSEPQARERQVRQIAEHTIDAANFVLEPLTNYSIVSKDPHQKPKGAKYPSKYVHSCVQPNYDSARIRAPHVYHRQISHRRETESRLPYPQGNQATHQGRSAALFAVH